MTRSRAWRRYQRTKQIDKWIRHYGYWGWFTDFKTGIVDIEAINLAARRRVQCSCSMCGNPRKFYKGWRGLTVQERRSAWPRKYNQGKY